MGSPSRAHGIAKFLDENPAQFVLASERGFTTITGCYKGVPISIVSIGMGYPNMDFFIREVRECLSGDMVVVRLVQAFVCMQATGINKFRDFVMKAGILWWSCRCARGIRCNSKGQRVRYPKL